MIINHHLLKEKPLYKNQYNTLVTLLCVYNTDNGLCFTTKIMEGKEKGKWSQSYKHQLTKKGDLK